MTRIFDPIADTQRDLQPLPNGLNTLIIRRTYDATPEDVWAALTDPQRIERWFLPVTGDLRLGGRFSLQDNASGDILHCERPRTIGLTWELGGGSSNVWIRLTPRGDATELELEHSPVSAEIVPNASPEMWGLGSGWEVGMTALGDYLAGKLPADGRAIDRIQNASPEELRAIGMLADRISQSWVKIIAAKV
jgi:uncharacterized protein YndB with AHSA1/START domain